MRIYLTRHGQTDMNRQKLMAGRTDIPLNDTGVAQAEAAREKIGAVTFDAVYASPLVRAVKTASIIGNVDPSEVITDRRIIEFDFGRYEGKKYYLLGPAMTAYWMLPQLIPAPKSVETIASAVKRSHDFLKELEQKESGNVLVVCHGGIIRPLCGYLEDKPGGIRWHPHPKNCEIRVYDCENGKHTFVRDYV
ncbi:MAG: histidine phosphatase family protein [Eubacteriales bacterium]|jgi:broad specificity phosphatase PhoE